MERFACIQMVALVKNPEDNKLEIVVVFCVCTDHCRGPETFGALPDIHASVALVMNSI